MRSRHSEIAAYLLIRHVPRHVSAYRRGGSGSSELGYFHFCVSVSLVAAACLSVVHAGQQSGQYRPRSCLGMCTGAAGCPQWLQGARIRSVTTHFGNSWITSFIDMRRSPCRGFVAGVFPTCHLYCAHSGAVLVHLVEDPIRTQARTVERRSMLISRVITWITVIT